MTITSKAIDAVVDAAEDLSWDLSDPQDVDSKMDVLASALLDLGAISFTRDEKKRFDLYDILVKYAKEGLIDDSAAGYCSEINNGIRRFDYDMHDGDSFRERIADEVDALQDEIKTAMKKLEKNVKKANE